MANNLRVYLVCGFRRTGKDTLLAQFNRDPNCPIPFDNWEIRARPSQPYFLIVQPVKQVSFAQPLKDMVIKKLGMPVDTDIEAIKDQPLSEEFRQSYSKGTTFRDVLIEVAKEGRLQDPDYWCKSAFAPNLSSPIPIMVTDWRYPNEKDFVAKLAKVITIRVFRKEVPVPTTESEIQLNADQTDYILTPVSSDQSQWSRAIEVLPQYRHYIPVGYISI